MKTSQLLSLLPVFFIAINCPAKTETDADITKALIGTWSDAKSENDLLHTKATYYANGLGVEFVWPKGQAASKAIRIESTWGVTNGILVLKSIKSSNPQIVPEGIELKDRIISISSDQFVFEPVGYANGKGKQTRYRIKEPK